MTDAMPNAYPETADIETSNDDYASRFSGETGQWMLELQEAITRSLLKPHGPHPLLDVGGGHGQLAIPLCRDGYPVTVLSSAESCRHRIADIVNSGHCSFKVGNLMEMPFADRAFPTLLAFRLLTHCERWPGLIHEMCRVAAHSIIIDYPTKQSLNAIAPMLFQAKKKIEKNTRSWRLFTHAELNEAFAKEGFVLKQRKAQFFLPMVLHRALKSRNLSAAFEGAFRATGLTAAWGSPVIAEFVRKHE
jgi:2-polyprenyl-3-methyl-5-hydroxy-6-metoxy-1,4-benzoquinol methylase